jgi:glucose-6-phosphate isomerase
VAASRSSIDAGAVSAPLDAVYARLAHAKFADALWDRRLEIWSRDQATRDVIANRLGWLSALEFVQPRLNDLVSFAERVKADGFTDIVLLGMGGSSLAPEVLRTIVGVAPGFPRFRMLDSVNPDEVRSAFARAETSLFVLASKSGSTIEPSVMAAEARRRAEAAGHSPWGSRFIAITDPESPLHAHARAEQFREIFLNPPDIGGRFSALSLFGMVPAALMGIPLDRVVQHATRMANACRVSEAEANPGVSLGALMAASFLDRRDKLMLVLPDRLASLGLWVEQLVAESTGKQGKGIVPIAGEPASHACGPDRFAVIVTLGGEVPDSVLLTRLRESGTPFIVINMPDETALGAEFLRWEVATATAGFLMNVNPFDEPNVQEAKDATRALLESFKRDGAIVPPASQDHLDGVSFSLSADAMRRLSTSGPRAFLNVLTAGDYFALLAYLPPSSETLAAVLERFRARVAERHGVATMFGYGPRYLHSTGQLHKGGAPNGAFVIVSCAADDDLPIPGESLSFNVLETAQAFGDFASLDRAGRRALLIRLPSPSPALLEKALQTLLHVE